MNTRLISLAKEYGLEMVITNDIHYIETQDAKAQDVLLCIQTNKKVDDPDRMKFGSEEFYVKSEEELGNILPGIPQLLSNTVKIAERCNVEIQFGDFHLPTCLLYTSRCV